MDWFAEDDDRLSDAALRTPLLALEEALTGRAWALTADGSPLGIRESRSPAIVSLVRSIAMHSRAHPAMRACTLAEIATGEIATGSSLSGAQTVSA